MTSVCLFWAAPYGPKISRWPHSALPEVSLGLVKRRTTRGLPQVKPAW